MHKKKGFTNLEFLLLLFFFRKKSDTEELLPPPPPLPEIEGKNLKVGKKVEKDFKKFVKKTKEKKPLIKKKGILPEHSLLPDIKEKKFKLRKKKIEEDLKKSLKEAKQEKPVIKKKGLLSIKEDIKPKIKLKLEKKKTKELKQLKKKKKIEKKVEEKLPSLEHIKIPEFKDLGKEIREEKLPEIEEKPEEVVKAEEEIQKAIEGLKNIEIKKPKKSLFSFLKKKYEKKYKEKIIEPEEIKIPEIEEKDLDIKEKELPEIEEKSEQVTELREEIEKSIGGVKKTETKKPLFSFFKKKKEQLVKKEEITRDKVEIINNKIHESRDALLTFNLEKTKQIYLEIIKIYNQLSDEEKSKVYYTIKELYDDRKSAEGLNLK